jgi:capsular polysaccharide biosynthesis protein
MNAEYDERISLEGLFSRILVRWKLIILFAIIFGLVGMGLYYLSYKKALKEYKPEAGVNTGTVDGIDGFENYDELLNNIDKEIESKLAYLKDSVLAKVNSSDAFVARVNYYITVEEENIDISAEIPAECFEVIQNKVKNIISSIRIAITTSIDMDTISKEMGIKEGHIYELIGTSTNDYNVLNISARYMDREGAEKILQYIIDNMGIQLDELKQAYGDFKLIMVSKDVRTELRNNMWWNEKADEINKLMTTRTNLLKNKTNLEAEAETAPTKPKLSKKKMLLQGIVYGVAGAVLCAVVLAAYLLLSGKLLAPSEVNGELGLKDLAYFPQTHLGKKKIKGLTYRFANAGRGLSKDMSYDDYYLIALSELGDNDGKSQKIGLLGDVSRDVLEDLGKALREKDECGNEFVALPALSENVSSRKALDECDSVILVNMIEKSRIKKIRKLMDIIDGREIEVKGSITL